MDNKSMVAAAAAAQGVYQALGPDPGRAHWLGAKGGKDLRWLGAFVAANPGVPVEAYWRHASAQIGALAEHWAAGKVSPARKAAFTTFAMVLQHLLDVEAADLARIRAETPSRPLVFTGTLKRTFEQPQPFGAKVVMD